jgi:hypothetical protein
LHSFHKTYNAELVEKDKQFLRAKYDKWLSEFDGSSNYKTDIKVFTISDSLAGEQDIPPDEEFIDFKNYHFVGVMVTFCSNESNKSIQPTPKSLRTLCPSDG